MGNFLLKLEGTAFTDNSGLAHSKFDAYLGFDTAKGEYFSTFKRKDAKEFTSETEAKAAFANYKKDKYSLRFASFEIESL